MNNTDVKASIKMTRCFAIQQANNEKISSLNDEVIIEQPVAIHINGSYHTTLLSSPKELGELAVGFLLSQRLIDNKEQIKDVNVIGKDQVDVTLPHLVAEEVNNKHRSNSETQKSAKDKIMLGLQPLPKEPLSNITLSATTIQQVMKDFSTASQTFLNTGAAHSAALMKDYRRILYAEDVARHNAVDKLVAKAFLQGLDVTNLAILTSCRTSVEILTKIARAQIPVIISQSAPTSLAVELARELHLTLIGFARDHRFNIYSSFIKFVK